MNQQADYQSIYTYFADWVHRQDFGGAEVSVSATLDDLGLDSLALVDLAYELKRERGLSIPLEHLDGVQTVDEVVAALLRTADGTAG